MANRDWFKSSVDIDVEKFRKSGLWFPIRLFRWWGLHLERDSAVVKKWHVMGILLASIPSSIAYILTLFYVLMDGAGLLESLGYGMVISAGFISTHTVYIYAIRNAKHYSLLMRSMASAIYRIPSPEVKKKCARNIFRSVGIGIFFFILLFAFFIYGFCREGSVWLQTNNRSWFDPFLLPLTFISLSVWLTTVGAFYIISHLMLKIVCDVIETLIDIYVLPKGVSGKIKDIWIEHSSSYSEPNGNENMSLVNKITFHQKISLMVIEANKVFSNFLLITLCVELLVSIALVKMMSVRDGQFSNTAQFGILQIFCIIWKALKCAHVNDKLRSSLTLTNVSTSPAELEQCSATRINYLVYMQEQAESKAILTYGGIFRAKKMFILTVVGTIITYTLVLNGISS